MKLLADENVKLRLVRWLEAQGHDVELGKKGLKDPSLLATANERGRILITNDTDFLKTALHPLENTPGRIVLRVFPPTLENQKRALLPVLSAFTEREYAGTLVEAWLGRYETRTK